MAATFPRGEHISTADQRLAMRGSWSDYETLNAMRGERSSPRITFLDGAVDLMSPSTDHERISALIARLVETFCVVRRIPIQPFGSWTLKDKALEAGAEPDQCFVFGAGRKERPDLAIEVVWTSGGLDKLEVYRRLCVHEVWFWIDDRISVHVLGPDGYEPREHSATLPALDLALVCELLHAETLNEADERMQAFARTLPD